MARKYFDNGNSFVTVDSSYKAKDGEEVFYDEPTEEELQEVFANRITVNADIAKEKKLTDLELGMHEYLYSHYSQDLQLAYIGKTLFYIFCTVAKLPLPLTENQVNGLVEIWNWIDAVMGHYTTIAAKIENNETITSEETQWKELFDASDPGYNSLRKFPKN